jgi:5'-phosphate synthase pdxT subunit
MLESVAEAQVDEIRHPGELDRIQALVMPGGESTAMIRLLDRDARWWDAVPGFRQRGGVILGTCAGLILLSREVEDAHQRCLGLLDVTVARNAYGRQIDSFEGSGQWANGRALEMVFIRAPGITRVGPEVEILATFDGEPVLVRQGSVLAGCFHPELGEDPSVHRLFLESIADAAGGRRRSA